MSGDYQLEDTVYLPFTTRAFSTGIPTALVAGEVQIYEDATVTQITTAETLTVSLDGVAGFNMVAVAATAANGFGTGQSYTAILSAGTVDSVSAVGEVVGHFTIEQSAAALDLANGTDGLGAIKADTAAILADTGTDGVVVASMNSNTLTASALATDAVTEIAAGVATHQIVDAVSADGTLPTIQEGLYELIQQTQESVLTGTTVSVKKQDGSTELFTLTVNDGTNPTSITRAT